MADYWKSQPRKFCQYCKCWIADNKPSVEFHERGKNHKENVAAKISEIKKKSIDKAKQEARMSKEFAAMEEAALKAYEEDLKRMERESAGLPAQVTTQPQPKAKPQSKSQIGPQIGPQAGPRAGPQAGPRAGPQAGPRAGSRAGPRAGPQAKKQKNQAKASWKSRGQTEAQVWVEGRTEDGHMYYYNTITGESKWGNPEGVRGENPEGVRGENPASAQPGRTESSSGCPWKEAVSPDGYTYYYNSETGETSWEKPAGFPSIEAPGTVPNKEGESQEEPPPPGGEERSSAALVPQEPEVPEQESQQSNAAKISLRKRKAEAEPSEEQGEDEMSDDAPKEAEEMKKEEEVQRTMAEPEEKKVEAAPVKKQARRPKTANPYGTWEKIREEEDPYAKVDLQLPKVEGSRNSSASAPAELPREPKPKFRERIITSIGGQSGPASFRKNKTQNGKSRSLRRRDDDDDG